MAEAQSKEKIVYLFGAGATHAELMNILPRLASDDRLQRRLGLLTSHLSARVMTEARSTRGFLRDLEFLEPPKKPESVDPAMGPSGAMNIELLISLIENSRIRKWEEKTRKLKSLVQTDIEGILQHRKVRFYLHKALLELHGLLENEELIAIISLNYDDVLDQAYKEVRGENPNYCSSFDRESRRSKQIPLLKLHGSFNWGNGISIRGRKRKVDIIPLGSNKNYLHTPYNFIWTRALEVLVECDTLRVIGCSLSQNDSHLVDLLFKAHLEKTPERMEAFKIEIIAKETVGKTIRSNYGFFPGIRTQQSEAENAFLTWLMAKSDRVLQTSLIKTRYLKRLKVAGLTRE